MNARSFDCDQLGSGVQSRDDQLMNISNRITCTAAEHCALVESQLQETKSSSTSCSSVDDASSCGDSADWNRCDPDVADNDCSPNDNANTSLNEPLGDNVNQSNYSQPTLSHSDEIVPTETTVDQLNSA
jgi:hypothetical protein